MKIRIQVEPSYAATVGTRNTTTGADGQTIDIEDGKTVELDVPAGHYVFVNPHPENAQAEIQARAPRVLDEEDDEDEIEGDGSDKTLQFAIATGPAGSGATALNPEAPAGQGAEAVQQPPQPEPQENDQAPEPKVATDDEIRAVVDSKGNDLARTNAGLYQMEALNTALAERGYAPITAAKRDELYPPA